MPHPPVDVVIIGGGIVGASLAFCLSALHGTSTVVLERDALASEATGLSAGTIWNVGSNTDGSSLGALLCDQTVRLLREVERRGHDCAFRAPGNLTIATDAAQLEWLRGTFADQRARGFNVELIDGAERVAALEPALRGGSVIGALHYPLSGHVDPSAATVSFAAAAAQSGATVLEGARVVAIERLQVSRIHRRVDADARGGRRRWCHALPEEEEEEEAAPSSAKAEAPSPRFAVHTARGDRIEARHVVIAAGVACAAVARLVDADLTVPVTAVRGQCWSTVAIDDDDDAEAAAPALCKVIFTTESRVQGWSTWSSRDDAHGIPEYCTHDAAGVQRTRHCYGRRTADGRIIFGGARVRCAEGDYSMSDAVFESNYAHVKEFLPCVGRHELLGSWCGLMPFSMDGSPIVGELDGVDLPGVWLAAGFGPHGIMEGPGAMHFLAKVMMAGGGEGGRGLSAAHSARFAEIHPMRSGCCGRRGEGMKKK